MADASNPGHFTGTIVTAPAFPFEIGGTTPGTENCRLLCGQWFARFHHRDRHVAPIFGAVEAQGRSRAHRQRTARTLNNNSTVIRRIFSR